MHSLHNIAIKDFDIVHPSQEEHSQYKHICRKDHSSMNGLSSGRNKESFLLWSREGSSRKRNQLSIITFPSAGRDEETINWSSIDWGGSEMRFESATSYTSSPPPPLLYKSDDAEEQRGFHIPTVKKKIHKIIIFFHVATKASFPHLLFSERKGGRGCSTKSENWFSIGPAEGGSIWGE